MKVKFDFSNGALYLENERRTPFNDKTDYVERNSIGIGSSWLYVRKVSELYDWIDKELYVSFSSTKNSTRVI